MGRVKEEVMAKARAKRQQRQQRQGKKVAANEQDASLGTRVKDTVVEAAEKAGDLMKSAAAAVTEAITGNESP